MLVVGFLPLVALFAIGYLAVRDALIEASDEHLRSVVESRSSRLRSWLGERLIDLEVIGGSKDCLEILEHAQAGLSHTEVCLYLDSFETGARDYQAIVLFDIDWKKISASSDSRLHNEPLADQETRRLLSEVRGPLIAPVHAHTELSKGFHLANQLRRSDGSVMGYVVASLDLTGTFAPILEDESGLGETGKVYLVDASGHVLLPCLDDSESVQRMLGQLPLSAPAPERVSELRREDGTTVLASFTAIPDQGWLLVATMDRGEALRLLNSLRRAFLVTGLLTLAVVVALSSRISQRLSRPLSSLAGAARRIQAGSHQARVPELDGREVAEVGHAFNEMLDALEETQRLRVQADTLAAVGELSSGVVHEMRNRLSSVKMNLQALEKHVRSDDTYAELGQIALEQLDRVETILTDLLNYARSEKLDLENVQVSTLLRSTTDRFHSHAEAKGVQIDVESVPDEWIARMDRGRMEEVLANLVLNALEAVSPGGRITLRARDDSRDGELLLLEVEDDGPGIHGPALAEIFRPFYTTKDQGTGLGLAQARKIVGLHGGTIGVCTGHLGGALFQVKISKGEGRS
jgi:signal transduction histidine kinase